MINKISQTFVTSLWVIFLPLGLSLLVCTVPLEVAYAQNSSGPSSGVSTSQNQKLSNKTVIATAPGAKAIVTTAGNKTIVTTAAASKTSNGSTSPPFNRTGFTNLYVLTINGKIFPIKYDIKGGKLVGILADTDRSTLVLVLDPGANGGNVTIELPRNMIDSKGASNSDTKYQVKIDGKGVDYKEVANNAYARVLSINFSKDNRFMEIIGTKIAS